MSLDEGRFRAGIAGPRSALLVIDLVNAFEFPCGETLFHRALPAARAIAVLQERARSAGVPILYVNDVFDSEASELHDLVMHYRGRSCRSRALLEFLAVDPERDHFVAKPMHSGFFRTDLEALLRRMRVEHLILTGVAADICVLVTAFDAHMRGFGLSVPCDCIAAESAEAERWALQHMARVLCADVRPSRALALSRAGTGA